MRECITTLIGQAGLQIGDVCWNIYRREHGINADGHKPYPDGDDNGCDGGKNINENETLDTLFNQCSYDGRYVPRSVLIDNEPSVVQSMLSRELYSSRMAVHGHEDAANNFARGFYTLSSKILEPSMDVIRKSMELCDNFLGFLMFSSFGGGTGSGFSSRLINEMEQCFGKKSRVELNVFPSPRLSTAIVEPYNAIFRAHTSMSYSSCMFLFDNEACYDICRRQLDVQRAHHYHINQLISQVASSLTASTRFRGPLNVDLPEFETNLVPYPRMHFLSASYAPVVNNIRTVGLNMTTKEITKRCFETKQQLIKFEPSNGKYISSCLLYRGDVTPKDTNAAIVDLRKKPREKIEFVKWSKTGLKTGISVQPPQMMLMNDDDNDTCQMKRSVCMLANNTAMVQCWQLLAKKFDLMFQKRAFVHWFVQEGMEEAEFVEAREGLANLCQEYRDIDQSGNVDESRYEKQNTEEEIHMINGDIEQSIVNGDCNNSIIIN